jgi:hypothetical protein
MEQIDREREPARKAGLWASGIVGVLLVHRILTAEQALAWTTILTLLFAAVAPYVTAELIRRKVMPVDTVKAAGLDPEEVNRAADDPSVRAFKEG